MKILKIKLQLVSLSTISCMLVATCVQASDQAKFHRLLAQLPELPVQEESDEPLDKLSQPPIAPPPSPSDLQPPSLDVIDEGMIESTRDGRLLDGKDKTEGMVPLIEPQADPPSPTLSSPKSILAPTPSDDLSSGLSLPSEPIRNPEWSPTVQAPLTFPSDPRNQVDFDQIFERQNRQPTDIAMAYENSPGIIPYGHGDSYLGQHCSSNRKPSLPPPDSLVSMYNGRDCYKDIWAGYAAEKQLECQQHHKHIHGTCDCLNKSARCHGPAILDKQNCSCQSCD